MDITKRTKGEVVVLDIAGEIDLYNAPEIKDIINKLIEERNTTSSSILKNFPNRFLRHRRPDFEPVKPEKIQGGFEDINVYASVRKVFRAHQAYLLFDIFDSEEDALESFNK